MNASRSPRLRRDRRILAIGLAALALAIIVFYSLALVLDDDPAPPATTVTVDALVANEERFAGEVVTVRGNVDADVLPGEDSAFSFLIGERTGSLVLVVPARPEVVPRGLGDDDEVRVTGEVHRLEPDEDEGRNVLPEGGILERFEESPSILATEVEVTS